MIYRFDRFQVDDDDFRLSADGSTVPLEPKTLSVLLYLIRNRSRVIRKGEILDGVWKEANVTESTLTRSIGLLRRALGDDSREPRFIETVPTVGFRFIAKTQRGGGGSYWTKRMELTKPHASLSCVPYDLALGYARLGDHDQAFFWIDRMFTDRCYLLTVAKVDPLLDPIRGDPRYEALLRRLNLLQ